MNNDKCFDIFFFFVLFFFSSFIVDVSRLTLKNSQAIVLDDDIITPRRFSCPDFEPRDHSPLWDSCNLAQRQSLFSLTGRLMSRPRDRER